jgi:hypothetical protein
MRSWLPSHRCKELDGQRGLALFFAAYGVSHKMLVAANLIHAIGAFMLAFRASENVFARELECSLTGVAKHLQHCPTTMAGDDEVPLSGFKDRKHRVAFHVPVIGLLESCGGWLTPGASLLELCLANSNRYATICGAGPRAAGVLERVAQRPFRRDATEE